MANYIKFPNQYVKCNIKSTYGLSHWFYITYITICLNRTLFDGNLSTISIAEILRRCGKKCYDRNPETTEKIKDALRFMLNKKWIYFLYHTELDKVKPSTHLMLILDEKRFFPTYNYSTVYYSQLHKIFTCNNVKKEKLLMIFLYLNSYCFSNRKRRQFNGSVSAMTEKLNISKTTATRYLSVLAGKQGDNKLFVKTETGYNVNDGEILKLPNIYEPLKLENIS